MSKINSRAKGARGEREFADFLAKRGHEARRGRQFRGGEDSPDVLTSLPFHFEVKRTERFQPHEAFAQAVRDSNGSKVPVVAHRRNHGEWLALLRMSDLLDLVEKASGHKPPRRIVRRMKP